MYYSMAEDWSFIFLNFVENLMKMLQIQDQQTPQRAHDRKYKLEWRLLIRKKKCEQAECGVSYFIISIYIFEPFKCGNIGL